MEKDKTTGKPAKVKPETVTEKQPVKATEKSETQQDSGEKDETATSEANGVAGEIAPNIRAQQAKEAAFIAPYAKAYPSEKSFCVTSDRQVFLERDRGLAVMHQTSLGNGEQVQTIRVSE